jgi:hypothetical protein
MARANNQESDGLKVILARSEADIILTLMLSPMGTWTPKFTFTLNALALDRLDRLEAMLRDSQEESQALRAELNTLSQLVERNADRIGDIKQTHGDPALLGASTAGPSVTEPLPLSKASMEPCAMAQLRILRVVFSSRAARWLTSD